MNNHFNKSGQDDDVLLNLANDVTLAQGESITMTLKDSHILDKHGNPMNNDQLVLEDVRLSELEKYAKYNRQKIKYAKAEGSILPVSLDDDEEEEEEQSYNLYNSDFYSLGENQVFLKPVTLEAGSVVQIKANLTATQPNKFIPRKPLHKKTRHSTNVFETKVSWDNLFADNNISQEEGFHGLRKRGEPKLSFAPPIQSPKAKKPLELPPPPKWSVLAEQDDVGDDMLHLVLDIAHKPSEVKEEIKQEMITQENLFPLGDHSGPSISATAEFAKSLLTPLEKLEEKRTRRTFMQISSQKTELEEDGNIPSTVHSDNLGDFDTSDAILDGGLASALEFVKKRGDLNAEDKWSVGRVGKVAKVPLHKGVGSDDVKIDYTDNFGRVMNAKEAFRYMSWHFHGKQPGKAKMEKRLKKMELEHKLKSTNPAESMPTLQALRATQENSGSAYLVLSSTDTTGHGPV